VKELSEGGKEEEKDSEDFYQASFDEPVAVKNGKWVEWKRIAVKDFPLFREKWKIKIDNNRSNTEDVAIYMKCRVPQCPV